MLPLLAMCDRLDVGGIVDSSNTGSPTVFLYDRFPGGMGFSERGFELFPELMEHCLRTIENCRCEDGCPSCVGLPVTRPAQQMDPDLGHGYPIPDKEAALVLLHHLLGREPYLPRQRRRPRRTKAAGPRPTKTEAPESVSEADQLTRRLRNVRRPRVGL
jgi:DEAD/DEAH box helicase domain-containing protein